MNPKRKQKPPAKADLQRNLRQGHTTAQTLAASEVSFLRESDYIVQRAIERDARYVSIGVLVFFSTESGDAWMLDTEDQLALCLARDGVPTPVRIVETGSTTAIEWDRTYSIEGAHFTTMENQTGRITSMLGYPTQAILAAIKKAKEAV